MAKDKYALMGPNTTLAEMVEVAAKALIVDGMNSFDFDIHGMSPDGPIVMHFEATIQRTGRS